jgi:hypothetical protein
METIETKPHGDIEVPDFTINLTERKCKCTVELIFFALLLTGGLISIKYSDSTLLPLVLLVSLIIPSVGIVSFFWDIPAKIELSKEQMVIYYGRSIMNNEFLEGRSIFPTVERIRWKNTLSFNLKSSKYTTNGGVEGSSEHSYRYLVITDRSIINLKKNPNERCRIRLNRFEKTLEEILAICKQFQLERS